MKNSDKTGKFNYSGGKPKKKLVLRVYGIPSHCNLADLKTFFQNYGEVKHLLVAKGRTSAALEFFKHEHAQRFLNFKTIRYGEDVLEIHESDYQFSVSNRYILRRLIEEFGKLGERLNFHDEVKLIREKVGLSPGSVEDRMAFVARLTAFVQQFFSEQVELKAFGSTLTGFGLIDADLDLTFTTDPSVQFQPTDVSGLDLKTMSFDELKARKLRTLEWRCIPTVVRIEFLARLLKQYEVETSEVSDVNFVTAVRVPLLTFKHNHIACDLTITNFLGMRKAELLQLTTQDYPELFNLLFFFRLWGRCAGLYKSNEHPTGVFSSYAFSLLFLCYCQHVKLLGPLEGDEIVNGVATGSKLVFLGGNSPNIKDFIRGFFEFSLEVFKSPKALCPNKGTVVPLDQFETPFSLYSHGFKISQVSNLQDPIEVTHNVTQSLDKAFMDKFLDRARDAVEALNNLEGDMGVAKELLNVLARRSSRVVSPEMEKMCIDDD